MKTRYDVVIVGAGPGGSATAHYLARAGLDVLLLDKASFPRDKTCGDGLTPRALAVLDDMGLLGDLLRAGRRIGGIEIVSPRGHTVDAPIPAGAGRPNYTLIVPRRILDDAIRQRARASGARFEGQVHVGNVVSEGQEALVSGAQGGRTVEFRGRLAVIATGASFKLLLRAGLLRRPPPVMLAARAYFEGINGLADQVQLRFDGVPLPGYGWVFPISDSSANVGAGYAPGGLLGRWKPDTGRAVYDAFVQTPALRALLAGARRASPIKGYPLRVDFARAPTFGPRMLLVGEAAGLVNPLTGEGIDYALESGKLAAGHIIATLAQGDYTDAAGAAYDALLRRHFQRLFVFCNWTRDIFVNPLLLDPMVRAAGRRSDLKMRLIDVVLGNREPDVSVGRVVRAVLNFEF